MRAIFAAFFFVVGVVFFGQGGVFAQVVSQEEVLAGVPAELRPWVEWVRQRHPEWQCPRAEGGFQCVWPGAVAYNLAERSGEFVLNAEVFAKAELALPSAAGMRPRDVRVLRDGAPVEVVIREDGERVFVGLGQGRYVISGQLVWEHQPPEIPLPGVYGILTMSGRRETAEQTIRRLPEFFRVEQGGSDQSSDNVSVTVARAVRDGSPLTVETRLRLYISGSARSITLGKILPADAVPVAVVSPLPFNIGHDGSVSIQAIPGEHELSVQAVLQQPVDEIKLPEPLLAEWPKEEVWSFFQNSSLRVVELSGASALHSELAQLPPDWQGGATYTVKTGAAVQFNTRRRGEADTLTNEISLARELWIDLNGSGFTARDRLIGQIYRDFRLNALDETKLGRATLDGKPALITGDPAAPLRGVELRRQTLDLEAVSRIESSSEISATGWNSPMQQAGITLHLPPSWKLLHVFGAASASGSWSASWTLLDIFITILLALGAYKLFGAPAGIVLAISLLLNHNEFLAPRMLLTHLLLLSAWNSLIHNRDSFWAAICKTLLIVTFCIWAVQVLTFAKLQLTQLMFPQLQAGTRYRTMIQELLTLLESSIAAWPLILGAIAVMVAALRWVLRAKNLFGGVLRFAGFAILGFFMLTFLGAMFASFVFVGGTRFGSELSSAPMEYERFSKQTARDYAAPAAQQEAMTLENKALLSGPAVPAWHWRTHSIAVPGPVMPDHKLAFSLLPPVASRIISALRLGLILGLLALFLKALGYWEAVKTIGKRSAAAAAMILLSCAHAEADLPSEHLLNELESRLSKTVCQRERCAVIEEVRIEFSRDSFLIKIKAASDGPASIALPGPLDVLSPGNVKLDGADTAAMRRGEDGYLLVKTANGVNRIEARGMLPHRSPFTVQFADKPLFVEVEAGDWYVEGLNANGYVDRALRFTDRKKSEGEIKETKAYLPAWIVLGRSIEVGEQISTQTIAARIGTLESEAHIRVPLLPSESITSGNAVVEGRYVVLHFPPGVKALHYNGTMPFSQQLTLTADKTPNVTEEWLVRCQTFISCSFAGIAPFNTITEGSRALRWYPYPGESVEVKSTVLSVPGGEFLTIDKVDYTVNWGASMLEGRVEVSARATQQTPLTIFAPGTINKVLLDGNPWGIAADKLEAAVLMLPGEHKITMHFAKPWETKFKEQVPPVRLSAPANNVTISLNPRSDRWLIWTGGAYWGPAVLFWAKLVLIAALCVALSVLRIIPANPVSAAFLGVGLTTLPTVLLGIPLLWLAAIKLLAAPPVFYLRLSRSVRSALLIILSVAGVLGLYTIVQTGLVLEPPMLIAGNRSSSEHLYWFVDHAADNLPEPWVISLPLWCWRVFSLVWSTWLVVALLSWLKLTVLRVREAAA